MIFVIECLVAVLLGIVVVFAAALAGGFVYGFVACLLEAYHANKPRDL